MPSSFCLPIIPVPASSASVVGNQLEAEGLAPAYPLVSAVRIILDFELESVAVGNTYLYSVNTSWDLTRSYANIDPPGGVGDGEFSLWWSGGLKGGQRIANWALIAFKEFTMSGLNASIRVKGLYKDVSGVAEVCQPGNARLVSGDSDGLLEVRIEVDNASLTPQPDTNATWNDPADMPVAPSTELWRADDATAKSTPFSSSIVDSNPDITWTINNFELRFIH